MASEAPVFWWEKADWRARALFPVSWIYGLVAGRRMAHAPREKVAVPVLCVGNLTVGGAGKTPTAIAMARAARRAGYKPGILSRGHGGTNAHTHLVDAKRDAARHVGDEPLLLAKHAPVVVTPKRAEGARALIAKGCDFLIMDDGFQSAHIHIDCALIVIDARRGLGNGHILPGGPVRAPVVRQMAFADAVLAVGDGAGAAGVIRRASRAGKPVYAATVKPKKARALRGRRFLAFAGIGDPDKFFLTVEAAGGTVVDRRRFGDHHVFAEDEIADLAAEAAGQDLDLITTEKDAVRLATGSDAARALAATVTVLEIGLGFEPADAPQRIIAATLEAYEARRHGVSRHG